MPNCILVILIKNNNIINITNKGITQVNFSEIESRNMKL